LSEVLQCPICFGVMKPPIWQCGSGHTICAVCLKSLHPKLCPQCRQGISKPVRNIALETLYYGTRLTCPNRNSGCSATVRGDELERHRSCCLYRSVKCSAVTNTCNCRQDAVSKPYKQIPEHLQNEHKIATYFSGQYCSHQEDLDWTDVEIPLAVWNFDGRSFLEEIYIEQDVVYILLLMFGEADILKKYDIEMQLIRAGLNCAPNIRKAIVPIEANVYNENNISQLQSAVVFTKKDFMDTMGRVNPATKKCCWLSRLDFRRKV